MYEYVLSGAVNVFASVVHFHFVADLARRTKLRKRTNLEASTVLIRLP